MLGEIDVKFSVVVPVKNEVALIRQTLWSYYAVKPAEVIICTDKPCEGTVEKQINNIAKLSDAGDITRIVEVEKSAEWGFHQAHVRRQGFCEAKFDRILTGDVDLVINKKVHKALRLVGENDVGLASLVKFHYPMHLMDYWRLGINMFLSKVVHGLVDSIMGTSSFSGLYALWRPYWLNSEPEEEIKSFVNPKQFLRGEKSYSEAVTGFAGEDTFLRDWMRRKYKCVYLRDIGAIDLGVSLEGHPFIQYRIGAYFARSGRSLPVSLGRAVLRAQPYYLKGYLAERDTIP